MIEILKPGLLTTVQDLGRPGYQRYGIAVGGALDGLAARVANLLVGNDEQAALLEIAQLGPTLCFTADMLIAWCGADFDVRIGDETIASDHTVRVAAGETLHFGPARKGLRAWLAIAGGIAVPAVMGSRSTYRRAGIGGVAGRALVARDGLETGVLSTWAQRVLASMQARQQRSSSWAVCPENIGLAARPGFVRAMPGPEWEAFTPAAQVAFYSTEWQATAEGDEMGLRLAGPVLELAMPREMISSAVNAGVVQVPASGQPIVLLAGRQSVGGYPRIAAVASVDLGRFAQLRPGDRVSFLRSTVAEAHALYLLREQDLQRARLGLRLLAE